MLGLNRWAPRVSAYAALMTDEYPPFRLDLGGADPGDQPVLPPTAGPLSGPSGAPTPYGPSRPEPTAAPPQPVPTGGPAYPPPADQSSAGQPTYGYPPQTGPDR